MKYIVIVALVAYIGFITFNATEVLAFGQSVGGKITSTTIPGVKCYGGTGPVTFTSAGSFSGYNYYFPFSLSTPPQSSKYFLGLSQGNGNCRAGKAPYEIDYYTSKVYYYGISIPTKMTSWGTYR